MDSAHANIRPETILEAWMGLQQLGGYSLDESRLPELLHTITQLIPSNASSEVKDLCNQKGDVSLLVEMLRPLDGQLHFLYFWKALTFVTRLMDMGACLDGVVSELELVRDGVLRHFDSALRCASSSSDPVPGRVSNLTLEMVVKEVKSAACSSLHPVFWDTALEALDTQDSQELTFEEVTQILVAWLLDAAIWDVQFCHTEAPLAPPSVKSEEVGIQVKLHIYDVSESSGIQRLNKVLAHEWNPFKFGGLFHAGVEVAGMEWGYGYQPDESRPGVHCCLPTKHFQHHFRQTVTLRCTKLDADKVNGVITQLIEDYPGDDYDLLHRNCCHFADDFCMRLGVGRIPGWVHRLARIGGTFEAVFSKAKNIVVPKDIEGVTAAIR